MFWNIPMDNVEIIPDFKNKILFTISKNKDYCSSLFYSLEFVILIVQKNGHYITKIIKFLTLQS